MTGPVGHLGRYPQVDFIHRLSMWNCKKCNELLGDELDLCHKCGEASRIVVEQEFAHSDDYEPESATAKHQFSLFDLLLLVNGIGMSLAGWMSQNTFLFLIGIYILGFMVLCWFITDNIRRKN